MTRKPIRTMMILLMVVFSFAAIMAWAADRKPVVRSEPLPCFSVGSVLVCVDGSLDSKLTCAAADINTFVCTNTP